MLPIGLMCSLNWSIFDLNCSSESSPDRCCSNRARIFGVTMGGLDSRSAWSLVESFSGSDLARISLDLFFSSAVSKVGWLTCGGLVCPESLIFILGTLLDFRPFSFVDWLISKIGARFWYQVLVSGFGIRFWYQVFIHGQSCLEPSHGVWVGLCVFLFI